MAEQKQIASHVDWRQRIARWDAMQTAYLPYRDTVPGIDEEKLQ